MKHMLNLLVLLSLSFAAQAGPGGPAIDDEGDAAADVKSSAAAARPATPPPTHVNVKKLRELGAITKMIEAVKDVKVLTRVLQFLTASQRDLETQVENPRHQSFKAIEKIGELMKAANAEEKAIYDAIVKYLQSFGVGKAAEKLEQVKVIFEITQEASLDLVSTPHLYE